MTDYKRIDKAITNFKGDFEKLEILEIVKEDLDWHSKDSYVARRIADLIKMGFVVKTSDSVPATYRLVNTITYKKTN